MPAQHRIEYSLFLFKVKLHVWTISLMGISNKTKVNFSFSNEFYTGAMYDISDSPIQVLHLNSNCL